MVPLKPPLMLSTEEKIARRKEWMKIIAMGCRDLRADLEDEGFSRDEAQEIVVSIAGSLDAGLLGGRGL